MQISRVRSTTARTQTLASHRRLARVWRNRSAYLLIAPFTLAWLLFYLIPLIRLIVTSFERAGIKSATFIGLGNYIHLSQDPSFWQAMGNTLTIVAVMVPIVTLLSLGIALVVDGTTLRWQSFFRFAFYIPVVASSVVLAIIWAKIYNPVDGILNDIIGVVGIAPVVWLGAIQTAMPAVIVVLVSFSLGVQIILFLAGLAAIPKDYYEAAAIDGASPLQLVRHISVPLLRPTILFVVVTQTVSAAQVFAIVQLLTQGGPVNSTDTLVFLTYRTAFSQLQFGYASSIAVVFLVLLSSIAWVQFRWFGKEVRY
jgi:multiple sugar transport system permease protein